MVLSPSTGTHVTGSPVVQLSKAYRRRRAGEVAAPSTLVGRLELDHHYGLHATRAGLLHRLVRVGAPVSDERALELIHADTAKPLERPLAELRSLIGALPTSER
jgi:predicted RNA polymerase sigma factor